MCSTTTHLTVNPREPDQRSGKSLESPPLLDVTERNAAAVAAHKVEQYAMELRNRNEQLRRALEAVRTATAAKSRFLASVSTNCARP
jgi:hypothetical protein